MAANWFYLSFADASRPAGTQWLGGLYVRAETLEAALTRSHELGENPGGEVQLVGPLPGEILELYVAPSARERLLTSEDGGRGGVKLTD